MHIKDAFQNSLSALNSSLCRCNTRLLVAFKRQVELRGNLSHLFILILRQSCSVFCHMEIAQKLKMFASPAVGDHTWQSALLRCHGGKTFSFFWFLCGLKNKLPLSPTESAAQAFSSLQCYCQIQWGCHRDPISSNPKVAFTPPVSNSNQ